MLHGVIYIYIYILWLSLIWADIGPISDLPPGDDARQRSAEPPGCYTDVWGPPAGHQLRRPGHVRLLRALPRLLPGVCRLGGAEVQPGDPEGAGNELHQVSCRRLDASKTAPSSANSVCTCLQVQLSEPEAAAGRPGAVAETVGEVRLRKCSVMEFDRCGDGWMCWTPFWDKKKSLFILRKCKRESSSCEFLYRVRCFE